MSKLKDLNINSITNAKGTDIPFVIVFTYLDEYIETFANKEDKAWKQFEKQYKNDRPKNGYHFVEDVQINLDDDDEPYKNKDIAIITSEALSSISEKDKEMLEFGIRVVDISSNIAYVIEDEMLEFLQLDNVNSGIPFDNVESTLTTIMKQVKRLNNAATKQDETKKIQEENKVEVEPNEEETNEVPDDDSSYVTYSEDNDNTEQNVSTIDSNEDNEQEDVPEDKTNEYVQPNNVNNNQEVSSVLSENQTSTLMFNNKEPETPLEFAQQDLLYEISKYFPEIKLPNNNNIPEDTVNMMSDSKLYDNILSIKQLTEAKLTKRTNSLENYLNNVRNDAILKVYNKLNRRLNVENDELMRKSDFTTEYSPFNDNYSELQSSYRNVVNSLADTKHEEINKNRQQHEMDKEAYVERAAKQAEEEFDRNNLHLVEGNAQKYIEEIKAEADIQYKENYELLEKDSKNWYAQNFNTLVPKLVHASKDEIEQIGESVTTRMQEGIEGLSKQMESDLDDFVNKVKDITSKEIETDQQNEELIQRRVHERTVEFTELKHQFDNLKNSNEQLKKDNRETYERAEEYRRDSIAEKKQNEALETALTNRNVDVNNSRDQYHQITQMIANGKMERLKEILDLDKVQPVKDSFVDKLKSFTNVIAAFIIAIGIIVAAVIFGTGNADSADQVSQGEVKSQVQQAINENDKKHDEEQKQNNDEIENLKKDLNDEKTKNDKDDKKALDDEKTKNDKKDEK